MLEQFRDIMIIISMFLFIGVALTLMIIIILLFRKISPVMDSARRIAGGVENVSSIVSGSLQVAASLLGKHFRGKEKRDGKGK
jgi:uncharacterized protein YoxC